MTRKQEKATASKEIMASASDVTPNTETGVNLPDRQLTDLLIMGVPVAVIGALLIEIPGPWHLVLLRFYALFLGGYLAWILGYEYYVFSQLHQLKSKPLDMLLVAGIFVPLDQFSKRAEDLSACLLSLAIFLLFLVIWEMYTMRRGYSSYFGYPLAPIENRISHWREYRYWLMLDGGLFLLITAAWLSHEYLERYVPADLVRSLIAYVGFLIGLVNVGRYEILKARIQKTRFARS